MATNLADVVSESAQQVPARVAVIDGERRITFAGLDDRITAFAAGLSSCGVKPGSRVFLMLGNRLEFVIAFYSVLRAGAVAVPINPRCTSAELEYMVSEVGGRLLISEHECSNVIAGADLAGCVTIAAGGSQWEAMESLGDPELLPSETDAASPAVMMFVAGYEGHPKAAVLSHGSLLANITALQGLPDPVPVLEQDVSLAVLPLFHIYSLNAVLGLSLAVGATVVLSQRFYPRQAIDLIKQHRVTVVAGVPPMYVAWSAEFDLRESLATVRLLMSGGAPLPSELYAQFPTMAGQPIWEGYGLTECSPVVATSLVAGMPREGSVGKPLPGVEVQIVVEGRTPDEPEAESEESEVGQIWIRGTSLFSGYWSDGAAEPDPQRWFATGDHGYIDDDGFLYIVSDRNDLILVSGFNVYPREVERVIHGLSGVADCCVVGVPHPLTGQAVKVYVVPGPGGPISTETVLSWCESQLSRYKCPTIIEVVPELPRQSHAELGGEYHR